MDKLKRIASDNRQIMNTQLAATLYNPVLLHMCQFYSRYLACTTTHTFNTYTSSTREKVQYINILKIHPIVE
jgi:hypothetical protein